MRIIINENTEKGKYASALELNNVTYAQPHIGVCTHYTNLCLSTSLHALAAVSYFHTAFVRSSHLLVQLLPLFVSLRVVRGAAISQSTSA